MLEKPNLPDEKIITCLRDAYGLQIAEITFLPLGADVNTAVYRATTTDSTSYFVKLRSGNFDTISVDVPGALHDQGIEAIAAPIPNHSAQLSTPLDVFNLILYPFIEGVGGWDKPLSDANWTAFGRALKAVHTVSLPPALAARIPRENYSPYWREQVKQFQAQVENTSFADPVADALAAFLKEKRRVVSHLIQRAEDLGAVLQHQPASHVLCHSDIHVGNLLINAAALYIVDWDQPIIAPKERDLMFIGGGLGGGSHPPEQEEALFYAGYGHTSIDPVALAYYRYERIVQDIAAYCQQLLSSEAGGANREEGLRQLSSQFLPGEVIDMAYRSEKQLPRELQAHW